MSDEALAGCLYKEAFATRRDAMRVLKRPQREDRKGRKVYKCAACNKFHIGGDFLKGKK